MKTPGPGPQPPPTDAPPSAAAPPPGEELIFRWQKPLGVFSWLPWFLSLSLLAHICTFFLFRVVYPGRVSIPPPAPQVYALSDANPEHAALLKWIDAEDPALIARLPNNSPPALLKAAYHPSFNIIRTAPHTAPVAEKSDNREFQVHTPLELIRHAQLASFHPEPPKSPLSTRITFAGALANRALTRQPPFNAPQSAAPLQQARFLIGVSDRGEVRYCFLQSSSGDPLVDNAASAQLTSLSFEPTSAQVVWGFATFLWGAEVYRNAPQPSPAP